MRFSVLFAIALLSAGPVLAQQQRIDPKDLKAPPKLPEMAGPSNVAGTMAQVSDENILLLDLSTGGRVKIVMRPDVAPKHVERIKTLVREGFYDGTVFHRVIDGFMAQGGDPTATGQGGSKLPDLKAEFNDLPHVRGAVAMARAQGDDSANSQFYLVLMPVLRLDRGAELRLLDDVTGEWAAEIAEVGRRRVTVRVGGMIRGRETVPDLWLLTAPIRPERFEWIVEKATELGAARIRLVTTARTQPQHLRLDRLDAIAEESAEQTGRMDVPAVDRPEKLDALLIGWDPARRLMFCDETGGAPAIGAVQAAGGGSWAILIGPEGGFTPEERDHLRALPFTTAVSLGPRVLRADTAATTALTLWQAAVGDWDR